MSTNILTRDEECHVKCSHYQWQCWPNKGDVRMCEHGNVMYCYRSRKWGWAPDWIRLTKWGSPVRYRRAVAALGGSKETE